MERQELTDLKGIGIFVLEVVLTPPIFVIMILMYAITLLLFFSPLPCFAPKGDYPHRACKGRDAQRS